MNKAHVEVWKSLEVRGGAWKSQLGKWTLIEPTSPILARVELARRGDLTENPADSN